MALHGWVQKEEEFSILSILKTGAPSMGELLNHRTGLSEPVLHPAIMLREQPIGQTTITGTQMSITGIVTIGISVVIL
jgi:hypothetical protein